VYESNFEGNLRIYGYMHPIVDDKIGYGFSFDQTLFDIIGIFFRWNKNHDEYSNILRIKKSYSVGLSYNTSFFDRSFTSGIAFGKHDSFIKYTDTEQYAELFSLHNVNKWISLSAHFQGIWNISSTKDRAFLAALKAQINF
jgi:hypothetical protein